MGRMTPLHRQALPEIDVFAALANPIRRELLVQLRRGPRGVTELARRFEVGRPAVSEHLQILRRARLVQDEARGRERYYHLDPRPLGEVGEWLFAFERYLEDRMLALERVLDEEEKR